MNAPSQSTALVALEAQLRPLAPQFKAALAGMMSAERLIRTVMISVERLPALLTCDRQSIFMAAMSAACLGLEVDGVTGQAFLIPFKNRAQLVIGYKGLTTLAARAGITIQGDVVREGDDFDFKKGSGAYVNHRPLLSTEGRRIIAVWATAEHRERPPVIEVMGIEEILAVKEKSPGARRSDSPWNDHKIGFPAMAAKTVKRRLWRSLPLSSGTVSYHAAARLDEAVDEQGKPAWITPDRGLEIDGQAEAVTPYEDSPTPSASKLIGTAASPPQSAADPGGEADHSPSLAADPALIEGYEKYWHAILDEDGALAEEIAKLWNSPQQKAERQRIGASERMTALIAKAKAAIEARKVAA